MKLHRLLAVVVLVTGTVLGTTMAHAGLFVGASVGDATVKEEETGVSFDASDTGSKIYAGFTFMKFFALEASYLDLGSPEDEINTGTDAKLDTTGWDVYAVGILPIGKHFELFAKVGVIVWDAEASYEGVTNGKSTDDGSDPAYGAGLAFVFGKHFAVRAEYERFELGDIDRAEMYSAGAEFRF